MRSAASVVAATFPILVAVALAVILILVPLLLLRYPDVVSALAVALATTVAAGLTVGELANLSREKVRKHGQSPTCVSKICE